MTSSELRRVEQFAVRLAQKAGEITLHYFGSAVKVEQKDDDSPVTRADREAETFIRNELQGAYPGMGVLGEEFGYRPGEQPYTWVVDPIDGTRSFVAGVPLYTVLVALVDGDWDGSGAPSSDSVLAGVIHAPATGESVFASRGNGATWSRAGRTEPARVSKRETLEGSSVMTTDWAALARREPQLFEQITLSGATTRTWGDAYGYLLVATGRADLMVDPIMSPWDLGPLPVVITEAGGTFTTVSGRHKLGTSALATSPGLARQLFDQDSED
jgi:histidinol-phosphatase